MACLNAPFWRSVLSDQGGTPYEYGVRRGLNAPYGARRFLTLISTSTSTSTSWSLNVPFGARCFLTRIQQLSNGSIWLVIMHLSALGAF